MYDPFISGSLLPNALYPNTSPRLSSLAAEIKPRRHSKSIIFLDPLSPWHNTGVMEHIQFQLQVQLDWDFFIFLFFYFFPPSFHYVHIYSWRSHHYCINLVHSSAERRSVGVVVLLLLLLLFVYIVVRVRRPSPFYKWNLMHHWMLVMTES